MNGGGGSTAVVALPDSAAPEATASLTTELDAKESGGPLAHEASWYADDESFSAAIQELLTLKSTVLGWSAEALAKGLAEFEKEGVVEVQ